jgi:hypothetical protein
MKKRHKHKLDNKHFGGKWNGYYSWYCIICKKKFNDSQVEHILNRKDKKELI